MTYRFANRNSKQRSRLSPHRADRRAEQTFLDDPPGRGATEHFAQQQPGYATTETPKAVWKIPLPPRVTNVE
jgi:hypothetical protein